MTSPTVYGRVYELGLTDSAGASSSIVAQLGYGPLGANPENESGWTWVNATYNAGCSGCGTSNHEYQASLTAPSAGAYAYAFRFSRDNLYWT
jgi:hypothetical protein